MTLGDLHTYLSKPLSVLGLRLQYITLTFCGDSVEPVIS